jgi:predicted lactoylglutathione lyase
MIFVNLPVVDLHRARVFYEAIGFMNEPRFTDDTAAAMQLSDAIFVMLLTHDKWRSFTTRPIPSTGSSEVMLALSCESRDEVNRMTDAAGVHGGKADINPLQDHGFLFSRSFTDPDGHIWESMWMDPAAARGEAQVSEAGVSG